FADVVARPVSHRAYSRRGHVPRTRDVPLPHLAETVGRVPTRGGQTGFAERDSRKRFADVVARPVSHRAYSRRGHVPRTRDVPLPHLARTVGRVPTRGGQTGFAARGSRKRFADVVARPVSHRAYSRRGHVARSR